MRWAAQRREKALRCLARLKARPDYELISHSAHCVLNLAAFQVQCGQEAAARDLFRKLNKSLNRIAGQNVGLQASDYPRLIEEVES